MNTISKQHLPNPNHHTAQTHHNFLTAWIIDDANLLTITDVNSHHQTSPYIFIITQSKQIRAIQHHLHNMQGVIPLNQNNQNSSFILNQQNNNFPQIAIHYQTAQNLGLLTQIKTPLTWTNFRYFLNHSSTLFLTKLSQAIQLLRWQTDYQFCGRCGHKTYYPNKHEFVKVCTVCHHHQYPRIQPCVITAIYRTHSITKKKQILLAHHHRHANEDNPMYGLIAGFVEVGESLEQAVEREVMEEVGLTIEQVSYLSSQAWPLPSNLMLGFTAKYLSGHINIQEDELVDAQFFDIHHLPKIPQKGTIARTLIEHIISTG